MDRYFVDIVFWEEIMKKIVTMISALLALAMLFSFTASADHTTVKWISPSDYKPPVEDYAYSFAVLGDTQILTREDGGAHAVTTKKTEYTKALYDWLVANVETKKIKYVMGVGDICEMSYDSGEWAVAKEQIMRLNGVVPYSLVRGNHDDSAWFMREVGVENPDYMATIEGGYGVAREQMLNNYRTIEVCGIKYLIMVLDYYPTDEVLEWAGQVITDHPEHRVIITTHSYIRSGGALITTYDTKYAPHGGNNGQEMWDKLVKKHENIFMVICGHVGNDDILVKQQRGEKGNIITTLLIDPQDIDEGYVRTAKEDPAGMVALLYFSNDGQRVYYEYYSTIRDLYVDQKTKSSKISNASAIVTTTGEVVETTAAPETTAESTEKSGCGSTLSIVALPVTIAALGTAVLGTKKRER